MKRVLTLQDFSCFGRCSLTIAIPIISAMGVECVAIPSAILSTHTGNLGEVVVIDTEIYIEPILDHLERLDIYFDVIYIGYLGSSLLISIAKRLIKTFKKENTIVLLDPVMGDNGRLYSRFSEEYVNEIKSLVDLSDLVVPNLTEASLLCGVNYIGEKVTFRFLEEIFKELNNKYTSRFVITGICLDEDYIGAASYGRLKDDRILHTTKRNTSHYHGTGDMFAGVMAGALAKKLSLDEAVLKGVKFILDVIEETVAADTDERYGLLFEGCLGSLTE